MESEKSASVHSEPAIIFEDDALLVLNKPAGLVVHADGRTVEPSLVDWLKAHYPALESVGGLHTLDSGRYIARFGLLHRIDRETSGVILAAKNDDAFYVLQRQFLDRSVEKIYRAFVHGIPDPDSGLVDLPIGRSRADFRKWTTGDDARGTLRPAMTAYRLLVAAGNIAELELSPKTGRTHQIRVHMDAIGHPLVADTRYGGAPALGFARLALHALSLAITFPEGKRKVFVAPLPSDFVHAETLLGTGDGTHT